VVVSASEKTTKHIGRPADVRYVLVPRLRLCLLAIAAVAELAVVPAEAAATAPGAIAPPVITGVPAEGQTLTATTGVWSGDPFVFEYAWFRCNPTDVNLTDTTGNSCVKFLAYGQSPTYTLTAEDVGYTIRVRVHATNNSGTTLQMSPPTAPIADDNPGSPVAGQGSPSSSEPSQACLQSGWTQLTPPVGVGSGNPTGGSGDLAHGWLYVSKSTSSSKVGICVRLQAGTAATPASVGGRLEIDPGAGIGVTPVAEVGSNANGCTVLGPHSDDGTTFVISTSRIVPSPANPASLCVTTLGQTDRVTIGFTNSAPAPIVHWIPDTGTPVGDIHLP
jgi:hypothetical protein